MLKVIYKCKHGTLVLILLITECFVICCCVCCTWSQRMMPKICIQRAYVFSCQYQTTIWILESAVPSCLGNMNQSFPRTDFSYCENLFLLRGLRNKSCGQAVYLASQANKKPSLSIQKAWKILSVRRKSKRKHIIPSWLDDLKIIQMINRSYFSTELSFLKRSGCQTL